MARTANSVSQVVESEKAKVGKKNKKNKGNNIAADSSMSKQAEILIS